MSNIYEGQYHTSIFKADAALYVCCWTFSPFWYLDVKTPTISVLGFVTHDTSVLLQKERAAKVFCISQYHYDSNWHDVGQTMPSQNRKEDSSRNEITTSFLCFSYTATTPTNKIKSFFSILFFPRNIGTTRSTTSSNYCWRNSQLSTSVSQSCSLVKQTKWSERNCANQKPPKPNHGILTDWWKVYRTTMYGYGGKGGPTKNIPISFVRYSRRK